MVEELIRVDPQVVLTRSGEYKQDIKPGAGGLLAPIVNLWKGEYQMTRFRKEMEKRLPCIVWDSDDGSYGAYTVEEEALVVSYTPCLTVIRKVDRSGRVEELPEWERPEITSPYLVVLCGGDVDRAREIIKGTSGSFEATSKS